MKYQDLAEYLDSVRQGMFDALLPEPPVRWVMTRGTTGASKLLPATQAHLSEILTVGARAIVNFALRKDDLDVLEKPVLNLSFPSEVTSFTTSAGEEKYGYSSGTYAKLNPSFGGTTLLPKQEEIDALGGGITRSDWERRFDLVYNAAKGVDVKSVMGVTPVMTAFANFLRKKKEGSPRDFWKMRALFCTSVSKIQSTYAPVLRRMYGDSSVVEMYTATEGVFAQQLDDLPYVSPNYDVYLFEVKTAGGTKMLYEMKEKEWGPLVVSTSLFPRYDIGDVVEALGKGYFRIIGRAKRSTSLEHVLYNLASFRFV